MRPFPNLDDEGFTISTNGGRAPLWSPDGDELVYRRSEGIILVSVAQNVFGSLRALFEDRYEKGYVILPYMFSNLLTHSYLHVF